MTVVVDASVALKWVFPEEDTEEALALRDRWREAAERLVAPPLFRAEVTNVLHRRVRRGEITPSDAAEALDALVALVAMAEPAGLYRRALDLAGGLGLGAAYDAIYLALAEAEECAVWTGDRRLVRAVQARFPRVHGLGEKP